MSVEEIAASPFQPPKEQTFHREPTFYEKVSTTILEQLRATFNRVLPSDHIKQLPAFYKYAFGTVLLLFMLGAFIGLMAAGYSTTRRQVFLSPLLDSDEADPYCETISVANTGNYLATQSGVWQGQNGFLYSDAAFTVTMTSFSLTTSQFALIMTNVYYILQKVGTLAVNQDLGTNLLYWFSFTAIPDSSNSAQRFYLVGDPTIVLNRQITTGTLSSNRGVCNMSSVALFDAATASLIANYDYHTYANNSFCQASVIDARYFNYLPGINDDTFRVSIDVRSVLTAIAINFGILEFDQLIEITTDRATFTYADNATYNSSYYYDPTFPGMVPIPCITTPDHKQCVIQAAPYFYAIPVFHHVGNSSYLPELCNCATMSWERKANQYDICNRFEFLVGFLFYPTSDPNILVSLAVKYQHNFTALNEAAFNASFINSYWGVHSPYAEELLTPEMEAKVFDFCEINGQYCRLMIFSVFDTSQSSWAISQYYYQLNHGACQDSFSVPWSSWYKLIENPFAPLVQSYQQCQASPATSLFTQLGIQVGNLSLATPLLIMFVLWLIRMYQRVFAVEIPRAYSKQEKDDALEALAISLLLARDRRLTALASEKSKSKQGKRARQELNASSTPPSRAVSFDTTYPSSLLSTVNIGSATEGAQGGAMYLSEAETRPQASASFIGSELSADNTNTSRRQLLWQLVEALEADAVYHEDVFELKREVQRQLEARNLKSDTWIDWHNVHSTAQQKILRHKIGNNTHEGRSNPSGDSQPESVLKRKGILRWLVRRPPEQRPAETKPQRRSHRNDALDEEEGKTAVELSSLSTTVSPLSAAVPSTPKLILNRISSSRSHRHEQYNSVYLDGHALPIVSVDLACDILHRLVHDLEQVVKLLHQAEDGHASLSETQQAQQRYWSMLREITTVLAALSSELIDDVLDSTVHVSGQTHSTLVALLMQVMMKHAAATLNCSVQQVQREHSTTVAYALPGDRIVTLVDLQNRQAVLTSSEGVDLESR